jgi:hypothetical protein
MFGQRFGGWVIHFPLVVCTSSLSTPAAYDGNTPLKVLGKLLTRTLPGKHSREP